MLVITEQCHSPEKSVRQREMEEECLSPQGIPSDRVQVYTKVDDFIYVHVHLCSLYQFSLLMFTKRELTKWEIRIDHTCTYNCILFANANIVLNIGMYIQVSRRPKNWSFCTIGFL